MLAVFLVAGAGCSQQEPQVTEDASNLTAVEVQQLARTDIRDELVYIGQVEPAREINVVSKLAAEVTAVNFDIGDYVEAGSVLFTVDAGDISDQIRQLEASIEAQDVGVRSAEYSLELAQAGSAQERLNELQYESGIASARYGSRSAQQARADTKETLEDLEDTEESLSAAVRAARAYYVSLPDGSAAVASLTAQVKSARDYYNSLSETDPAKEEARIILDTLTAELNAAQATWYQKEKALNELTALESQLASIRSGVSQAESGLESAKLARDQAGSALSYAQESYEAYQELAEESKARAVQQAKLGVQSAQAGKHVSEVQLSVAQSSLRNAVVSSPISGVISARNIEEGQLISQAAVPFTIIDMDTVHIQVNVSETLINAVHVGDEVEVLVRAVGEKPLSGTVTAVSPAAGMTSTYPIRIALDNREGLLKPGMFARVTFVRRQSENAIVLDKNVVQTDEEGSFVYVVEEGLARRRPVTTGLTNGPQIEITGGLSQGDDVVVLGQEYLAHETPVKVVGRDGERVESAA